MASDRWSISVAVIRRNGRLDRCIRVGYQLSDAAPAHRFMGIFLRFGDRLDVGDESADDEFWSESAVAGLHRRGDGHCDYGCRAHCIATDAVISLPGWRFSRVCLDLAGDSGSFILLILGLYGIVIEAIKTLDLMVLGIVASGCAFGLVCFAQVLTRLFKHARDGTLAVLTGFMLGSLVKLWPWKETLAYQLGADGHNIPLVQEPVLPATYVLLTGTDPQIELALMAMVAGCIAVIMLDWLATAGTGHDDQQHG